MAEQTVQPESRAAHLEIVNLVGRGRFNLTLGGGGDRMQDNDVANEKLRGLLHRLDVPQRWRLWSSPEAC